MKVTIVESPYNTPSHNRAECIRYALWCCVDADLRGECAFASHLLYTQFIPETKEGRERGLSYRDEIARRTLGLVARYVDIGQTPGMFRQCDGASRTVERRLEGQVRELWLQGFWPEGSLKCR